MISDLVLIVIVMVVWWCVISAIYGMIASMSNSKGTRWRNKGDDE